MRRTILGTLLSITFLGMFGCVEFPTDYNSSPYKVDLENIPDSDFLKDTEHAPNNLKLSCVVLFDRKEHWSPIDSVTSCTYCHLKRQVGYTVDPLEGSCTKSRFILYKYKPIYGCYKYCEGNPIDDSL